MSISVMSLVYGRKVGGANLKSVLLKLADYANDEGGNIWPALGTVAKHTELSINTVRRMVHVAVKRKLLVVVEEGGKGARDTTRYKIDLTAICALPKHSIGEDSHRGSLPQTKDSHREGLKTPTVGVDPPLDPSNKNTSPTPSQAKGSRKSLLSPDWELPDDWREWAIEACSSRSLWVSSEAEKFRDYHVGKGTKWVDWRRAWQNWWRTACERQTPKGTMSAPAKTLAPDKKLKAPVWNFQPEEPVKYRADTPEFNRHITELIRTGSLDEAERVQQQGWVKLYPTKTLNGLVAGIIQKGRAA